MKLKKSKTSVCKGALSLVVVLALALGSCTKEPLGLSMLGGDGMEVQVTFAQSVVARTTTEGTDVGSPDENRLENVTILVFNEDGSKLETVLSVDATAANIDAIHPKWKSDKTLRVSSMVNESSPKKIYAIANWGKKTFDKATYTEALLKKELTTLAAMADMNGLKAYPMLMSGSKEVAKLDATLVTVDMVRQAAKIKAMVTLKKVVQDNLPNIRWQTKLMKITVAKVPNKSYVISSGASPAGITWINSAEITVDDKNSAQTAPATNDLTWDASFYINENPIMGKDQENATYIVVQLPYINTANYALVLDNYYKLLVNDKSDADSPHKVLRNTIYNFNISIIGLGLSQNLLPDVNVENVLTVNDWENGEIFEVGGSQKYFKVDRTAIGLQMDGLPSVSTIVTGVPDWKLTNADGETLFSFAQNKIEAFTLDGITYTLGGTVNAATITVSNPPAITAFPKHQMFFVAYNLKVPFTVTYDNGFIPNSVLIDAKWPLYLLPFEGGLQIAKRGDKVLPRGVAGGDDSDPLLIWKTDPSATPGVELVTASDGSGCIFGEGKGSTYAMTKTAELLALHPAAAYCRAMGPEWYLPSLAELKVIYKCINDRIFGPSYTFSPTSYWSATEYNAASSWAVNLADGALRQGRHKGGNQKVRCVKGMLQSPPDSSYVPTKELVGWPEDRLPRFGLQVATRGTKLLPGAVPEVEAPSMQWKTDLTSTPGVELVTARDGSGSRLGEGKRSTDAMTATPELRALHPAAAYCREMGPEWYLPSLAEIKAISEYENKGLFGSGYTFSPTTYRSIYWCSTEYNYSDGWTVDVLSGYVCHMNKYYNYRTRCVREI